MRIRSLLLSTAATVVLAACTKTEEKLVPNPPAGTPANVGKAPSADDGLVPVPKPVQTPGAALGPPSPQNPDMDAHRAELMTRPTTVGDITVKHVLLAFKGTIDKATRTKEEALA